MQTESTGVQPNSPTVPLHLGQAGWLVPARVDQPELLDLGVGSPDDVRQSLADLWRINRYLGGIRALTAHLYPRLLAAEGHVSCVDIGAGAGQISAVIGAWARRNQRDVQVIALDLAARNLEVARAFTAQTPNVALLQADAMQLPFAASSADYMVSSLFLHHFTPDQIIALLRAAYASARRGIIMSDLVRGWLPLASFRLITPVFARSYITRYDGAVSVRRAYTPAEFRDLARAAGLTTARVHSHMPWRMTLVADK